MNQNELRVENYVQKNGEQFIADHITILMAHNYSGIPLTEEWLVKFEAKRGIAFYWNIDKVKSLEIAINNDTAEIQWYVYFRNKGEKITQDDFVLLRKDLKYVHQLQNLYYALTSHELKTKI